MAIFWFHLVLISSSILLSLGIAARCFFLAQEGEPLKNHSLALLSLALAISLGIYLWFFVRRRGTWKS